MSLPDLIRWLSADWTHAVTAAGLLALGYALAWAAIRASYERVVGRPMPRTRLVLVLDILADLAVNVPGAVNRLLRSTGRDPLFLPAPPAPRPPAAPSGRSGEAGRASPAALALAAFVGLLALVFVGLALQGCDPTREAILRATPTVPRVDGCTPGDLRCHDNAPEVCSASGRWWPALSRHADGTPRTCVGSCRIEDGDAYCSPLVEGDTR